MITFYLTEAIKSLLKAKLSSFFSFITTAIAIMFILISVSLVVFSNLLQQGITERVSVQLFLDENLSGQETDALIKSLKEDQYFNRIRYISKEDAEKNFIAETGEDFSRILEYNPLPASIELGIKSEYFRSIKRITDTLRRTEGVDEVYYEADFIQTLLNLLGDIRYYLMTAAMILVVISFYLVYSTNRIILQTRIKQIETMKLVGARLNTIRFPVIISGLFIGIMSSLLVIIISAYLFSVVKNNYPINVLSLSDNIALLIFILFCGIVIGVLGSYLAVRKVSLRVNKFVF